MIKCDLMIYGNLIHFNGYLIKRSGMNYVIENSDGDAVFGGAYQLEQAIQYCLEQSQ